MSEYLLDGYYRESAANAPTNVRLQFIKRTYGLLLCAIVALVALEAALIHSGIGENILRTMYGSPIGPLVTILVMIGTGFVARYLARSGASPAVQYLGLLIEVLVWGLILLAPMYFCSKVPQYQDVPLQAGILTLTVFGGLSTIVFVSKKDFSFLGKILWILSLAALAVIVCAFFTPLSLGLWFSAAMIVLACGYILYDTSNVLHHYPPDAHVAAALELFSSVAYLFFYIVRLLMQLSRD